MRKLVFATSVALAALGSTGVASAKEAAVQVRFIGDTAMYADFGDSPSQRETNTRDLTAVFAELSDQLPAGQSLQVEILDVNLAGELEWLRNAQRFRVMRDIGWPMLELRYTLSQDGQVLKQGQARLSDMAYLTQSLRLGSGGQAMPYEQRMVARWMKDKLLTP